MAQVNKDTMIGELLSIDAGVAPILLSIGMHCLGCPSSRDGNHRRSSFGSRY